MQAPLTGLALMLELTSGGFGVMVPMVAATRGGPPSLAVSAEALLTEMTSKQVPTAAGISKPRASTSAGTMTKPPPTPKKPVSSPTPVAALSR
jgi:hypothetical protein